MKRRFVINCYLLSGPDVAQSDKEDVAIEDLHVAIGLAGMVDVMSAVPTFAAVEAPAIINCADTQSSAACSKISFRIRDLLARVLCNLPTTSEVHAGKAALAFNGGGPND